MATCFTRGTAYLVAQREIDASLILVFVRERTFYSL